MLSAKKLRKEQTFMQLALLSPIQKYKSAIRLILEIRYRNIRYKNSKKQSTAVENGKNEGDKKI